MNKENNLADIKKYHNVLFDASVTDKEKMSLTSIIALLVTKNYKGFQTKYEELLLNKEKSSIEVMEELAEDYLKSMHIDSNFKTKVISLWKPLKAKAILTNVKKGETKQNLIRIIESFVNDCYKHTNATKEEAVDFLGKMFAEINGKGANKRTGIVLTPYFLADFMTDLLDLDYKTDILFDGACGSGSFLITGFLKMYENLEKDHQEKIISQEEYEIYKKQLQSSIIGNDIDEQMAVLALTNFVLLGIDIENISNKDFFKLTKDETDFAEKGINKGILNPPFEFKPLDFCKEMVSSLYKVKDKKRKFVVICPPQSLGKNSGDLYAILNCARLDSVIEVQNNAFQESGVNVGTSIFVFDFDRPHKKEDKVLYYDFSDSGIEYFKDSGLMDKEGKFEEKKKLAIETIEKPREIIDGVNRRTFTSFFDIDERTNFISFIDPEKIRFKDVEEIDLTKANQEMKMILREKKEIIDKVGNKIDATDEFENYLVEVLSKVGEKDEE